MKGFWWNVMDHAGIRVLEHDRSSAVWGWSDGSQVTRSEVKPNTQPIKGPAGLWVNRLMTFILINNIAKVVFVVGVFLDQQICLYWFYNIEQCNLYCRKLLQYRKIWSYKRFAYWSWETNCLTFQSAVSNSTDERNIVYWSWINYCIDTKIIAEIKATIAHLPALMFDQ
jgi:hypothetical protein